VSCEKCGKGLREGIALFRQNPKGEIGVWRCAACNTKPIDSEVMEIIQLMKGIEE